MSHHTPVPVVTLWVGSQLGKLERLSLRSFVANGHPTTLYTYGPVGGVPPGVVLRGAEELVPRTKVESLRMKSGSYALFSDYFRYVLQARGAGLWIDTDVICLRPITLVSPVIFGWESDSFINGAVLRLPAGSPVLADALAAFEMDRIPEWVPLHRSPYALMRQVLGQRLSASEMPRGSFGPKALTALARRHGLEVQAQSRETFYPLHPRDAMRLYDPTLTLEEIIGPGTLAIHLWNEKLGKLKGMPPARGSILDSLLRRYPEDLP